MTTGPRAISARLLPSRERNSRSRKATRMRVRETPVAAGAVVVVETAPARADRESDELCEPPEQAARRATSGRTRSFFICENLRGGAVGSPLCRTFWKTPAPARMGHQCFSKFADLLAELFYAAHFFVGGPGPTEKNSRKSGPERAELAGCVPAPAVEQV